jgi:uncharacterized DUF497 family protein
LYVYNDAVDVVLDPEQARSNLKMHGVRFSDAEPVLFDPDALTTEDASAESEQRFVAVGADSSGRVLVVVYAHRGEDIHD